MVEARAHNGFTLPPIGLGTYRLNGGAGAEAVATAARGVVPLPKSQNPTRQRENLAAAGISLAEDEVEAITALGRHDGRLNDQDPAVYEEF